MNEEEDRDASARPSVTLSYRRPPVVGSDKYTPRVSKLAVAALTLSVLSCPVLDGLLLSPVLYAMSIYFRSDWAAWLLLLPPACSLIFGVIALK